MNRLLKIKTLLLVVVLACAPLSAQTAAPKTVPELQTRISQILAKP